MTRPTVGVIGLGLMGGNVASRLVEAGFDVFGYDVVPEARERAADEGITVASDTATVAAECDVVVTSLPSSDDVREAYLGDGGIVDGADENGLVAIELSTINPDTTVEVADRAGARGVALVDAPVSGGPEAAATGTLTVLGGGDAEVVESPPVTAVLDAISARSFHVGDVGAGHTAKLLNNVMSMGNLLLAMEAVSLGVDRGLDGERLLQALSNAGGSSNQFEKRLPRVLNRNFEPGFTVALARKDLGLALEMAQGSDRWMPVTAVVHQLYTEAVSEGFADRDVGVVAKLFERDSPIEADQEVDESYEGY